MPSSRDSSLLFSLRSLEALEAERLERERAAEARALTEAAARRAAEERRAREAEVRRVEEEERRRLDAERVRRAEDARLEAEKLAAIERARAEEDARSRAELAAAHSAHEIELTRVRAAAATGRYRFLLGLSIAATLVVGSMAGVLSRKLRDVSEMDVRRASALESARKDRERAEQALDGARREIGDLRARLASPSAGAGSSDAAKGLTTPGGPSGSPANAHGKKPIRQKPGSTDALPTECAEGDPLGGCLPAKKK